MKKINKLTQIITTHWVHWHSNDPFDMDSMAEDQYYKIPTIMLNKAKAFMFANACGDFSSLITDPPPGDYLSRSMLDAWNCTDGIVYASGPVVDEPNCLSIEFFSNQLSCDKMRAPRSRAHDLTLGFALLLLFCLLFSIAPIAYINLESCLRSEESTVLLPYKRKNKCLCCFFSRGKNTRSSPHSTYGTATPELNFNEVELALRQ